MSTSDAVPVDWEAAADEAPVRGGGGRAPWRHARRGTARGGRARGRHARPRRPGAVQRDARGGSRAPNRGAPRGEPPPTRPTPCFPAPAPRPLPPLPRPTSAASSGDLLCAVCLDTIPLPALATLPGCDHAYCAPCILAWAMAATAANPVAGGGAACGDAAPCPQCKAPFTSVVTHRRLDGSLTEEPAEESVCLLVRARWFLDGREAAATDADARGKAAAPPPHWSDDDEYDDEEEDYYFSAAAGRARVVLGNRRFGDGGVLAAGRMRARPAAAAARGGKGKAGPAEAAAAASASAEKGRRARRAEKRGVSGPPQRGASASAAVAAAGSAACGR